jgi:hypothetical protein
MDSKLKYLRWDERVPPGKTKAKKIAMVFLVPGRDYDGYICPAGPKLRPIPKGGQWYEYTVYLAKRLRCGDAKEGTPPDVVAAQKPKPKKEKDKK